ncbi:acyl-CoA carboxylase subunit epsilon [Actinocatenispora sera]|uniref:acyl-CoA carboxylase subunit epsilon n=1 Tax=Actinocatenispora sera TaxID=390989 RepID=UPI0033CDCEB2
MLRVVRGEPTAEELAALVTAIASVRAGAPAAAPAPPPLWRDPAARLGVTRRGPLAWPTSARPR